LGKDIPTVLRKQNNMNLQENIQRIKEVMGLNESVEIRRRLNMLPKYIRSTYKWLDPKRFSSFDEFIERVFFGTTRDFIDEFEVNSYDQRLQIRDEFFPYIKEYILENFKDEIEEYYMDNI
jgi:hypothetical protein